MATTIDPHQLAREGLVYLKPDGALAQWVEQAIDVLKELDWSYGEPWGLHGEDAVTEAQLADGYTHLRNVYFLLFDLVTGGKYFNDEGRAKAREFVDVMVR